MTLVVVTAMAIGPYINYIFSALAPYLIGRSILTASQIGLIVTTIFGMATVTSRAAGVVVDRRGSRSGTNILFGFATASVVVIAAGDSVFIFLIAAVLAGWAHALSHPVTNAMVSESVVPRRQGLTVGLKQAGVQVSQFGAGLVLPLLAPVIGWRLAVLTGLVLVVLGMLGLRALGPAPKSSSRSKEKSRYKTDATAAWMAGYALLLGASLQGTNVYLSVFAFERLGFHETTAGLLVGFVGAAGIVARITWGVFVNRVAAFWKPLTVVSLLVLLAVITFWSAMAVGPPSVIVGVVIFSIGATAVSVLLSLAVIQSSTRAAVGVNSGVVMRGLYAGYMAGPFLFGQLVTHWGYSWAWATMAVLAASAAFVSATGVRRNP